MHHQSAAIEVLHPSVVEKIAAGEVIERPASVLKELIENAIDAGATAVDVSIESAGFSLIKVKDNGCGMSQENLGRCLLPHATSKIRRAEDLFAVATMGFRGEALASIAAVSRITVASCDGNGGLGHEVSAEGGVRAGMRPVAQTRGTSVEVRDLFFNVPARKKFMKSQRGEQMALARVVEQLSVPFPLIHFTLTIDGNRAIDLPPVDAPLARIGALAGNDFAKGLIACRNARPGMEALIFVSSPEVLSARPRFQSLYVNLRRVDNDSVQYAIREAFGQFLGAHYRPSFFCLLDIDPANIDVNVHPTKQLVKFDDERTLFGFIFSAVKQGIGGSVVTQPDITGVHVPLMENVAVGAPDTDPTQEKLSFPATPTPPIEAPGDYHQSILAFPGTPSANVPEGPRAVVDAETSWDLISCYQIHETYILAPIKNGILLIDQHAAHERILYEQALRDIKGGRACSQQLLFPVTIELTPVEKAIVVSGRACFAAFGFETSDFSGDTLLVSSMPSFMKTIEVEETIRSMVRYLLDEKERDVVHETEIRFAAAFACGAAIKAGQKLSHEEMNALVNSLFAAQNPYTCPHGRPTLVRMSLEELSRRFLR